MATASLVLGIVSIVLVFVPGFNFIGMICGVVGIVFGAITLKNLKETGQPLGIAKGGLITSIVGASLAALLYVSCFLCAMGTACVATNCACQMSKLCDSASLHLQQNPQQTAPAKEKQK